MTRRRSFSCGASRNSSGTQVVSGPRWIDSDAVANASGGGAGTGGAWRSSPDAAFTSGPPPHCGSSDESLLGSSIGGGGGAVQAQCKIHELLTEVNILFQLVFQSS